MGWKFRGGGCFIISTCSLIRWSKSGRWWSVIAEMPWRAKAIDGGGHVRNMEILSFDRV